MHDIVIKNGTVVTATDMFKADVAIERRKIAAIGSRCPEGQKEIDAAGKLVIPGGIDSHCHVEQRMMGGHVLNADDFFTGHSSAAAAAPPPSSASSFSRENGTFADIVPYTESGQSAPRSTTASICRSQTPHRRFSTRNFRA